MLIRASAILSAVLLLTAFQARAAAGPEASFQCEIKDGGKTLRVWGVNPTEKEAKCSISCVFHQTDDKDFKLPCTATLPAKAANKPLCESRDAERAVDYVEGMGSKCN